MRRVRSMTLLAVGLLILLAACSSYGGLNRERLKACIGEASITGQHTVSFSLRNNRTQILVSTGPNVTRAQADVANACIAQAVASPLPPMDQQQPSGAPRSVTTSVPADSTPPTSGPSAAPALPEAPRAMTMSTSIDVTSATPGPSAAPMPVDASPTPVRAATPEPCDLEMLGGSGYSCAR